MIIIEVNKGNLEPPARIHRNSYVHRHVSIVTLQVPESQSQVCGILCS